MAAATRAGRRFRALMSRSGRRRGSLLRKPSRLVGPVCWSSVASNSKLPAAARALGRIRTFDTRFRKPVLYPLSYEGEMSRIARIYLAFPGSSGRSTTLPDVRLGRTWAAL